jgi:hypothetical protein
MLISTEYGFSHDTIIKERKVAASAVSLLQVYGNLTAKLPHKSSSNKYAVEIYLLQICF